MPIDYKNVIKALGFIPKENTSGIFQKKYSDYAIEIDFENSTFDYGYKIKVENKILQNFLQAENWVVLECVNRLLEKGYQPQNITLEKTWKTGHGTSGRLDILVSHDNGNAYLMIECKTWGTEFEKEFKKIKKDGGQLFTYFQQDKDAGILMLYTSEWDGKDIKYRNKIIKIEEEYRQAGNIKDLFERWNKLLKSNGIFDDWVSPYEFQSKALTNKHLKVLKQEDSSFIYNRFLEILRHNVVSDKPNAFNKIFNLFLCKIVDEYSKTEDKELAFQWLEGQDDHITFQKRLTDLYNKGMNELLEKKVTDLSDDEFDKRFNQVEEEYRKEFKDILTEIRLKKNNEFAIKEVYDDASFEENAKVIKQVVELLQVYKIRYNYRQQFLSDFFELLLTTGLKQESGQFFTTVPVARFIIKSLPLKEITTQKIERGNKDDLLPTIIDYAAGSGHFLTESMEEAQKHIQNIDESKCNPITQRSLKKWKEDPFDWAEKYVYGIEKDYRLVKTAKVSCYLHGDGLAKIIHGDGLGDFKTSDEFKDLLKTTDNTYSQDNKRFDIVISNPPYSVSAFKGTLMTEDKAKQAFDVYTRLTDQSSEIECLFIERTKQLLKDGGVAGIILPSSILSNAGIYTQAREILLKYFEILAIAKLGSNTFMATGTNTVILFLRRRNNADAYNVEESIKKIFNDHQDVTINGIEKPVEKYLIHVWDTVEFQDYKTLLDKTPNENILQHPIYKGYTENIKTKNKQEFWKRIFALEQNKLLYFILTYSQKLVLVETGEKDEEKHFLGYEFRNRRGKEGIHPVIKGKSIDECTQLYDIDSFTNPEKASFYIYKAFNGEFDLDIPENLQKNINYQHLKDILTFDQVGFKKTISLNVKKKIQIKSKWDLYRIGDVCDLYQPKTITSAQIKNSGNYKVYGANGVIGYYSEYNHENGEVAITCRGATCGTINITEPKSWITGNAMVAQPKDENKLLKKYLELFLCFSDLSSIITGTAQPQITRKKLSPFKIILPPKSVQEKILAEIDIVEQKERSLKNKIKAHRKNIDQKFQTARKNVITTFRLDDKTQFEVSIGKRVLKSETKEGIKGIPIYSANVYKPFGVINKNLLTNFDKPSVIWGIDGDWMVNIIPENNPFYPTDHCGVIRVKTDKLNAYYLALVLEEKGFEKKFSRTFRASTNRIKAIKVEAPDESTLNLFEVEVKKIKKQITQIELELVTMNGQKEQILKKYLQT